MGSFSLWHWLIVLLIVVLVFGTKKLRNIGGDVGGAEFWTGLRPATPDGTPIVGATAYRNLFLNTGHGTLGWTMACGSGRFLADLMANKRPQISAEGLDISRYGRTKESHKHVHPAPAH